jgi:hypothetical protein
MAMTALLLAMTLLATPNAPGPNRYLEESRKRYQNLEYEATLDLLKQAMSWPGTSGAELAQIHLFRGLCNLQIGREANGRDAFRAALLADRSVQLPPLTSPKIRQIFQAEAAALAKEHAAEPAQAEVVPTTEPAVAVAVAPEPAQSDKPVALSAAPPKLADPPPLASPSPSPTEEQRAMEREHVRWPAYVTWGAAAVAAGVGGAFGYQVKDLTDRSGSAHFASDNVQLNQQAKDKAKVANGFYGAAAGLAVLGGVFFFVF